MVGTVKWGHPCFTHNDQNIALIGAFRDNFRLNFMNPALLKYPEQAFEKAGQNTQSAGIKPPKTQADFDLPEELVEALASDPELSEAYHNLTPGRQRSFVINLNSAKASATRTARNAKFRGKIIAGKGATER